jgi:hypothetical protein
MIKKVNNGYALFSKDGKKRLSAIYPTRDHPGLKQREREVSYFKHLKGTQK